MSSNTNLFGQSAKQLDYFLILTLNVSDLQDYMINSKFEFQGIETDDFAERYTWTYDRNIKNASLAQGFFTLNLYKEGTKGFSFQSTNVEDYKRFKNNIKKKGLILIKSENIDGKLVERFSNSIYECRIWTSLVKTNTIYEMNLDMN